MPPQRMASATCPTGAAATCSQLGNLSLSCANARSELVSEGSCEVTSATTPSMPGSTGLGTNAPCSARSRRCTSLMQPLPGAVMGGWYPSQKQESQVLRADLIRRDITTIVKPYGP